MQLTVPSDVRTQSRAWLERELVSIFAVLLILVLCVPMLQAGRARLTSDESLYLAEAMNIAEGRGAIYPTGEPVVQRAPAYPVMQAAVFKLAGTSYENARFLPALAIVANALLLFLLARALFGTWAGVVAGVLAAASPYLRGFGTTVFLDGVQMTFMLSSLLALWYGYRRESLSLYAASGALMGVSFLIKESSILLVPLPLMLMLSQGMARDWKRCLLGWYAAFILLTGWWWVWVFAHTGHVFLLGSPDSRPVLGSLAFGSIAVAGGLVFLWRAPLRAVANLPTRLVVVGFLLAWGGFFLAGLHHAGWNFDDNYLHNVPDYFTTIFASAAQPSPFMAVGWIWAIAAMLRGNRACAFLLLNVALFASFALFAAERYVSVRDMMIYIYLSFVVVGGAAAALVQWGTNLDRGQATQMLGRSGFAVGAVVLAVVVIGNGVGVSQAKVNDLQEDWENPLVHDVSAWMTANLSPGTHVMSTRIYYSHIYFLSNGRFPIYQMPTVEATPKLSARAGESGLTRRSTLFRWENDRLPADQPSDTWIYLTRQPQRYFIAMAEQDLLNDLREREIEYVLLSSQDAGFSSTSLIAYFETNPAFTLVTQFSATNQDGTRIYKVDQSRLAPVASPMQVTSLAYKYAVERLGETGAETYFRNLNPAGFSVTSR